MWYIDGAGDTDRIYLDRFLVSSPMRRKAPHLLSVLIASAALAACAQSPTTTNKSELISTGRHASVEGTRTAQIAPHKRVAAITNNYTPFATDNHAAETMGTSYGLASYYSEGAQTASGEQFDPNALTAAHPNLPFGTKLRVTNVATGRSVIVRVNDRGPFVPGRVVDVSSSAAAALGIVGQGTAKVKLDVVK
jgi:rare lipoprotein A